MRRNFRIILYVFLVAAIVFLLGQVFPKYLKFLPYLFIFLLLDAYLWSSVRSVIRRFHRALRPALTVFYWLPVILLVTQMIFGLFKPYADWNLVLKGHGQNVVLILFLAKLFPLLALLLSDLIRWSRFGVRILYLKSFKPHSGFKPQEHPGFSTPAQPGYDASNEDAPAGADAGIGLRVPARSRFLLATGWTLGGILLVLMVCGTFIWQYDFRVARKDIVIADLPAGFDKLRIVQLSDLHLGSWVSKSALEEAVKLVNSEKPDLIFVTGDLFNYRTADGEGFEDVLNKLRAPDGIFYILGNHDYGAYIHWDNQTMIAKNMEDIPRYMEKLGWRLLRNEHVVVHRGSDSIAIIGVENWGATRRFQRYGNVAKAQKGIESMSMKLLLSHDPSHWEYIVRKDYPDIDITFSGHTHGGQIGIDLPWLHWSPVQWTSTFWCGLYQHDTPGARQYLYVNQGLGTIGYSGRVGIKPEITVFTLSAKK